MSGVSHRNCDETHQTFQQGRPALVSHGRPSLAALAVGGLQSLLSSRHVAGAALACVRPAGGVSSGVAVVAAVRVQLSVQSPAGRCGHAASSREQRPSAPCRKLSICICLQVRSTFGKPASHLCPHFRIYCQQQGFDSLNWLNRPALMSVIGKIFAEVPVVPLPTRNICHEWVFVKPKNFVVAEFMARYVRERKMGHCINLNSRKYAAQVSGVEKLRATRGD